MDNRRFWSFLVVSMAILWFWNLVVMPKIAPPPKPPVVEGKEGKPGEIKPGEENSAEEEDPAVAANDAGAGGDNKKPAAPKLKPRQYPAKKDITIGSIDPTSPYRMEVSFNSAGAVVSQIKLNDARYPDLGPKGGPLSLLNPDPGALKTLQLRVPQIDAILQKFDLDLTKDNWEILPKSHTKDAITWRYLSPNDKLEVRKAFHLGQIKGADEHQAYQLRCELQFLNHGTKEQLVNYELTGPSGTLLENREYTSRTREVAVGFLKNGSVNSKLLSPDTIDSRINKGQIEEWTAPIKYIGVDTQYFALLLLPQEDQQKVQYIKTATAIFAAPALAPPFNKPKYRDVSVEMKSFELAVPPASKASPGEIQHDWELFAGPKREDLLRPIGAQGTIIYGMSGGLGIPQAMLWLLGVFSQAFSFLPFKYGWAIIMLTVVVRSCMFPLSRKQAISAARMQELQPEMAALKKKFEKTPEKFGPAVMELYRKNNVNPLGGCLPVFIQLPIFIGLYQALSISVDLRGADFFYVDNLAAPDALFDFPFRVPYLGPTFNLLPLITVGLFLIQQSLFMPPATTPEEKMQHRMFKIMTVLMGFMFYSVPAGLCIYFIASSIWSVAERKLLPKAKKADTTAASPTIVQTTATRLPPRR